MSARDARNPLHRETGDFFLRQLRHQILLVVGIDEADQNGFRLHLINHIERGRLNGHHHIGVGQQFPAIFHEDNVFVGRVRKAAGFTGTGLHVQLPAQFHDLGRDGGDKSYTTFIGQRLPQNRNIDVHFVNFPGPRNEAPC